MSLIKNFKESISSIEIEIDKDNLGSEKDINLLRSAITELKYNYDMREVNDASLIYSHTYGFTYDEKKDYYCCEIDIKIKQKDKQKTLKLEVSIDGVYKFDASVVPFEAKRKMVELLYPELEEFITSFSVIAFGFPMSIPKLEINEQELGKSKMIK